jgi:DNA-binding Xre family transcriptional regulator
VVNILSESLVDRLIDIINREADIYSDILKISENKTNVIVNGKVSELEGLVSLEQTMIVNMGKLEDEREDVVKKLASQLNVEPANVNILSSRIRSRKIRRKDWMPAGTTCLVRWKRSGM